MEAVGQYLANGVLIGGAYGLIAVSIVMIYKATAIFNFAVGEMVMLGGFVLWSLAVTVGLPLPLSIVLTLGIGFLLGLAIERFTLRPLIGQPLLSSILVTLALAYFLGGVGKTIWGGITEMSPLVLPGMPMFVGGISFSNELLWIFFAAVVIFLVLALFYQRTGVGLAMRATADSHQLAQVHGINVRNVFSLTWGLAGVICGTCGFLLASRVGVSQFISGIGLKAFPAVLFGGLDSILGAFIGGLAVGILENLAGGLIAPWMMEVTPYIILLLVLIFMPHGLFGLKRIERI